MAKSSDCTPALSNKLSSNYINPYLSIKWTRYAHINLCHFFSSSWCQGERGGSVVECRTLEREVRGSRPTAAVLCPWARHFTPRKYWLITQEAMAPSRYDWKIVDWDVKPQHNQILVSGLGCNLCLWLFLDFSVYLFSHPYKLEVSGIWFHFTFDNNSYEQTV